MGWLLDGLKKVGETVVKNLPKLATTAIDGLSNGGIIGAITKVGQSVGSMALDSFGITTAIKPTTVANEKPTPVPSVQSNSDVVLEMPSPVVASAPVVLESTGTDGPVSGSRSSLYDDDDYGLVEARAIVQSMYTRTILRG